MTQLSNRSSTGNVAILATYGYGWLMTATTSPAATSAAAVAARAGHALRMRELSQVDAARQIGVDKTKLSKSLSGARRFRLEELSAIADLTDVSLDWLTRGADSQPPAERHPADTLADAPAGTSAGTAAGTTAEAVADASAGTVADAAAAGRKAVAAGPGGAKAQRMRTRIADAAWQLFSEWGYHRVRMIDIASRAGISAAGLHYHYTSKQEVFVAALQHSAARLQRERAALLDSTAAVTRSEHTQLLRALIELKLPPGFAARITDAETSTILAGDWSIWLQNFAEIAVGAGSRTAASTLAAAWDAVLTDCLSAGDSAGAFDVGAPDEAAAQLTIFLDGLVLRTLAGAADDPQALIDRYLAATILAPAPTGSTTHPAPAPRARPATSKGESAS